MSHTVNGSVFSASAVAVLAAYLAGSIPFGYLIPYLTKGIDIRTVGSGNPGATNVGRVLGARYFILVLVLDLLKGFLPTACLPRLVSHATGGHLADLPVVLALAAILGHTYPVFLRFRGGKGVATSLGAVLALDPVSCGVAVGVFLLLLGVTRYVSLSSLGGGLAFVVAHFLRDSAPLSREHIAMSLFSTAVLGLLVARHRGNLARLRAGTENRIQFGRGAATPPRPSDHAGAGHGEAASETGAGAGPPATSGRIGILLVGSLLVLSLALAGGIWVYRHASQPIEANAGLWTLRETDRVATGLQRIDGVAFVAQGTRLAATCPRYGRVILYQVELQGKLSLLREVDLEGRPVGLATLANGFIVLVSPANDQRHVEPGWWQCFDFDGNRKGGRKLAGFYPDDLAVTPDGRHLLVVTSGRAEGDDKKPFPALDVVAIDPDAETTRAVGHVNFDARDDPVRLTVSASGKCAAVLLTKTNETVAVDLTDIHAPRVIGRSKPSGAEEPYLSYSPQHDWILMPVASLAEAVPIKPPQAGPPAEVAPGPDQGDSSRPNYLLCTRQRDSILELVKTSPLQSLGHIPLKGPLNLGRTRPSGLAYSPERELAAVATRTGTIHMIALAPRSPARAGSTAAGERDAARR